MPPSDPSSPKPFLLNAKPFNLDAETRGSEKSDDHARLADQRFLKAVAAPSGTMQTDAIACG